MPSKKIRLEICGSSYVVSTNDSEEYLLELADRLDEDMKKIMADSPNASVTSAAVIAALGYLDEAAKNAFGADNMRAQIQDYLEDAAKAKMAAEEARREAERFKREAAHYKELAEKANPGKQEKTSAVKAVPLAMQPADVQAAAEEAVAQLDGQLGLDEIQ